jgi:hypothetical protein
LADHGAWRDVDDRPELSRADDEARDSESERPTDELTEELTRTVKAAYQ